jgi:hypothetical protein
VVKAVSASASQINKCFGSDAGTVERGVSKIMRTFEPEFKVGQLVKGIDRFNDRISMGRVIEIHTEYDWGKPEHYYVLDSDGAMISEEVLMPAGIFDRIIHHPVYALITLLLVLAFISIASEDGYQHAKKQEQLVASFWQADGSKYYSGSPDVRKR